MINFCLVITVVKCILQCDHLSCFVVLEIRLWVCCERSVISAFRFWCSGVFVLLAQSETSSMNIEDFASHFGVVNEFLGVHIFCDFEYEGDLRVSLSFLEFNGDFQ